MKLPLKFVKKQYKKIAVAFSLITFMAWLILGTGTMLAWFTDATPEIKNIFHVGTLPDASGSFTVSHRLENGSYAKVEGGTAVFDDEALYSPGFYQIAYLKIENGTNVEIDVSTAVSVTDYTVAVNQYGQRFELQDYLRFGLVASSDEDELEAMLATDEQVAAFADGRLNNYSSDVAILAPGETVYMALIVYMPEDVDNVANYRGDVVPMVELGIIIKATQTGQ